MKKKYFLTISMIVLCAITFPNANAKPSVNDKENVRLFVQQFYDWYTVLYAKDMSLQKNPTPSDLIALKQKRQYFDVSLRNAILEDNRAQAKVTDEITGLDFDPFLNTQDTGFAYQTGNVKQVGNKFYVDIHSDQAGKSRQAILKSEVAVIAEVIKVDTYWIFTNFIYPSKDGKSDLITILKKLRKDHSINAK
jgi:hypothetical protein